MNFIESDTFKQLAWQNGEPTLDSRRIFARWGIQLPVTGVGTVDKLSGILDPTALMDIFYDEIGVANIAGLSRGLVRRIRTNGGGLFNANGAHPYANPTPFTNFLGLLAIAIPPAALMMTFGHLTQKPRAGWLLLTVMVAVVPER